MCSEGSSRPTLSAGGDQIVCKEDGPRKQVQSSYAHFTVFVLLASVEFLIALPSPRLSPKPVQLVTTTSWLRFAKSSRPRGLEQLTERRGDQFRGKRLLLKQSENYPEDQLSHVCVFLK